MQEHYLVISGNESEVSERKTFCVLSIAEEYFEEIKGIDFYTSLIKIDENEIETILKHTDND